MAVSETKKTNKYAALATYLIAIVCLILGLFLPLFNGKGILALQLPQALNSLAGKEILKFGKEFTFAYPVCFLGKGKLFDLMAVIVLLYAVITVLGLLALIPVALSVKKDGKAYVAFMRTIETAAVLVLSLYVIIALEQVAFIKLSYNMIIAFGGSLLMLVLLCFMTKDKSGAAKFFLLLFSLIAVLSLFDLTALVPKLGEPLTKLSDKLKFSYLFVGSAESSLPGITYLSMLFEGTGIPVESSSLSYFDILKNLPALKDKAAMVLITIVALVAVVNYLIDVLALSSNGKRAGLLFNLVRYGLALLALIAFVITMFVCKYKIGLMLIMFAIAVLLQVLISVLRYVLAIKRAKRAAIIRAEEESTITFVKPPRRIQQKSNDDIIIEKARAHAGERRAEERRPRPEVVDMEVVKAPVKVREVEPVGEVTAVPVRETVETIEPVQEVIPGAEPIQEIRPEPVQEVEPEPAPAPEEGKPGPVQQTIENLEPVQEIKPEPAPAPKEVKPEPAPAPAPKEVKPEPVQEIKPEPAPAPAPKEAKPEPVQEAKSVTGPIYIVGQSSDEFLKKLNDEEKFEFTRTFIEKINGNIGSVPEYVIGGDNKKFFSSVFIYLGRLRGMISDNLLNKMYQELNML